jgi:hypothetical protein
VLHRLFTPAERHGWVGEALVERASLPWFHEVLTGTDGTPWSYVTPDVRQGVLSRLTPSTEPIPERPEHCPSCGCSGMWRYGLKPGDPPSTRRVDPETARMMTERGLDVPTGHEVPGRRTDGVSWWCDGCRTTTVREAAAALVLDCRTDILSRGIDQSVLNAAGIVDFVHTDAATRERHDPARPWSWLEPARIRSAMPRTVAAGLRGRMSRAVG